MDSDQPSLAAALAALQQSLPHIKKATSSHHGKYADLATISAALLPKLGKNGLSFMACPRMQDGQFVLAYRLWHVSGEHIGGDYPLPPMTQGPQALGSAITYARRYALCAVTGAVADEDDDGNAAQKASKPRARQRQAAPEVDEHGAATFAEQTRMVTGAVDGVERLNGTPDDDPWLTVDENGERREPGQLPQPIGPQPPKPGSAQARIEQVGVIVKYLDNLGITDRAQRLAVTTALAGLPKGSMKSSKDLTNAQSKAVINVLSHMGTPADLVAYMARLEMDQAADLAPA